jgi:hypothetical protein
MKGRQRATPLQAVEALLSRKLAVELDELRRTLDTTSRTTVFRVLTLTKAGYLTSYSHAGKYYTLRRIPKFDANGLWFHGEVRFSVHGTLRATIVVLVRKSAAGYTHDELALILGLRVHDTLLSLVKARLLAREQSEAVYVYFDVDPERQRAQREQRQRQRVTAPVLAARPPPPLDLSRVVEVLVALLQAPSDEPPSIGARLRAGGTDVSDEQVEAVIKHYALQKKTARSRSPRSRR